MARGRKRNSKRLPDWALYSIIAGGTAGLIYGLMQYDRPRRLIRAVVDPIADTLTDIFGYDEMNDIENSFSLEEDLKTLEDDIGMTKSIL